MISNTCLRQQISSIVFPVKITHEFASLPLTFYIEIVEARVRDHEVATLSDLILVKLLDLRRHHDDLSGLYGKNRKGKFVITAN